MNSPHALPSPLLRQTINSSALCIALAAASTSMAQPAQAEQPEQPEQREQREQTEQTKQTERAAQISERIRPAGQVCLIATPCVGSGADTMRTAARQAASVAPSVASPATPPSAPSAAPQSAPPPEQETTASVPAAPSSSAPAAPAAASDNAASTAFDPAATYQQFCNACHATGIGGAPKLDDTAAWEERMGKGMDAVMANVINGFGAMPPKGLCMACSDDELQALVDYMTP